MLIVSITVDGRNPAPVDIENIPYFIGFIYNRWLAGFLPTVINTYIGFSIRHSPEPKMTPKSFHPTDFSERRVQLLIL